ncbi:MAG TPA: Gfo/Idh/MocA family oxidoreductase [Candidatus Methylomirabilis sp.]|nr:Gfo/Idh/MocA family oxidoreductase [Candidatus Methylomirabilis sp.]
MTDKIRVGIVGATVTQGGSGWGANAHVPALKALPDYELAAVCTAHEETARASAAAFGVARAFHQFGAMAAHPEIDLIVVCVRVPGHRDLVMAGLQAGKAVLCEWPLGANLAEAQEMAGLARQRSLKTIVGLQGRSDPAILYARDLVQVGFIGEVLTASLHTATPAVLQRGPGRIWQGVRANGANTLTIAGGHAIDSLCAILGEFAELSARVSTRIPEWRTLEGKPVAVDSPDTINVVGRMVNGAEVSVTVAAVPSNPSGNRIEIYGRAGALVVRADGSLNIGPSHVHAGKGKEPVVSMPIPAKYKVAPENTPDGQAYNVAQAYARATDTLRGRGSFDVDFNLAVQRHKMIDAIERSSATGRSVKVDQA